WKLQKRQTHAAYEYLIRPDPRRRRKTIRTGSRDQVVLVHTIAADADRADQHSIFIQWHAPWEDLNSVSQAGDGTARSNWATQRCKKICPDEIELQSNIKRTPVGERRAEWSSRRVVNPVRKEWTMKKSDRTIAERN